MDIIDSLKIKLLRKKIEAKKKAAEMNGKFSLFHAKTVIDTFNVTASYSAMKSIYDIIDSWEGYCNIPYNIGVSLDKLVSNPNIVVCIHRTNLNLDRSASGIDPKEDLISIMESGLINYGHINAAGGPGFIKTLPDLSLTMTSLDGIGGYINLVAPYKNNDVIILAAFPKAKFDSKGKLISGLVKSDGHIVGFSKASKIYDLSKNGPKVKSNFIIGAILKKDNGLDEFYTRDEIINSKKLCEVKNVK